MNKPKAYKEGVCHACRKLGDRTVKVLQNNLCVLTEPFHYQQYQKLKYTKNLAKEQARQKKYAAKALEKQKEKVYKKPSVYIELPSGEVGTLDLKLIEEPKKNRTPAKEKSISKLISEATEVFNRWIRHRDCPDGWGHCISCNEVVSFEEGHAGHFWPAGSNGAVRFDELNVSLQCPKCNLELHGNQTEYLKGLYRKYGSEEVEALAVRAKQPFKWDREKLLQIIEEYKNKQFLSKAS